MLGPKEYDEVCKALTHYTVGDLHRLLHAVGFEMAKRFKDMPEMKGKSVAFLSAHPDKISSIIVGNGSAAPDVEAVYAVLKERLQ